MQLYTRCFRKSTDEQRSEEHCKKIGNRDASLLDATLDWKMSGSRAIDQNNCMHVVVKPQDDAEYYVKVAEA